MSARAKPRAWSGEDANARAVGVFVYDTEAGWCSVTSLAVCCCRVSMRPAVVVHEGKKYGPQQAKMVMQSVADYSKQILKLQDEAIGKRRIKESRSQQVQEDAGDCRRADSDSVSVRGESRGTGFASGHKDCVVCMDVFPQRQSLSGSNRLCSLRTPSLLELAVRFIHLRHTHAPGPAVGEISKNEGWLVEGQVFSRSGLGGGWLWEVCPRYREMSRWDQMQGNCDDARCGRKV